jgi:hypothetical protein
MEIQEHLVDQTLGCKKRTEDQRVGYKRSRAGQEYHRAEEAFEAEILVVQDLRQKNGQNQHDRHFDNQVQECILQGSDEDFILENTRIVEIPGIRPGQLGTLAGFERRYERLDHGPEAHNADHDRRRHQKEPAGSPLLCSDAFPFFTHSFPSTQKVKKGGDAEGIPARVTD